VDGPTSPGRSSALLWAAVFAPGLVCVALGAFVVDSGLLVGVGIVLLVAPLVVQMFGPDWDRETIPEGHHHDHANHHDDEYDGHDARPV
jgi:hypothetical protein